MKGFIREYYKFFIYTICIILFIVAIYNILINIKHALYLNEKIIVTDIDDNYKNFKNNIILIENNLEKSKNSNLYNPILNTLALLKQNGIFRLMPGDKLTYTDLYDLNNYFLDSIINNGWIVNFTDIKTVNTEFNNQYVDILINNANYINKELLNNSNFSYTYNNNIRDNINEEYQYILNNYQKFSYLILEISNKMGNSYA